MNNYTVVFLQTMPVSMDFAAVHIVLLKADSPDQAATICKQGVGGYAVVLCVMEGHQTPLLKGKIRGRPIMVWDDRERYKTEEIDVPEWAPPKKETVTLTQEEDEE